MGSDRRVGAEGLEPEGGPLMAGDWLKIRHDLPDDPAVIGIASRLGVSENEVVGALVRVWSWFDRQSHDGHAESVTTAWLDRAGCLTGLATAMAAEGWLQVEDPQGGLGLSLPNWERHCSESAKSRALAAERKRRQRSGSVTQESRAERDQAGTREEKRREREEEHQNARARAEGAPRPSSSGGGKTRIAETWEQVLERPAYSKLRESTAFTEDWARWISWCETKGSKAQVPRGEQAAALFDTALRVGIQRFLETLRAALMGNWATPVPEWLPDGEGAGKSSEAPTKEEPRGRAVPEGLPPEVEEARRALEEPEDDFWSDPDRPTWAELAKLSPKEQEARRSEWLAKRKGSGAVSNGAS